MSLSLSSSAINNLQNMTLFLNKSSKYNSDNFARNNEDIFTL